MTLRARLSLAYGAAIALTLAVAGTVVWWQLGATLRETLDRTLATRAADVAATLENNAQVGLQETDAAHAGIFVVLFDAAGHRIDATAGAPSPLPAAAAGTSREVRVAGVPYLLRAAASNDGSIVVVAGSSLRPIEGAQATLAGLLMLVGLGASLVSLLGGWWLAGRALRPVAAMTRRAAEIGALDLDQRLPEPAVDDELGRLARTLNAMLERLEHSVRQQREFVAAASHDLRTPLAALQTELELAERPGVGPDALRQAIRDAHGDVVRLAALANALLDLSVAQPEGRALVRQPVRLAELVEALLGRTATLAQQRHVEVVHREPDAVVVLDRLRLEQAVANLLDNAITYGPAGVPVELLFDLERAPGPPGSPGWVLAVQVLDRGPGLPDAVREHLFVPFRRGPNATGPGFGLGLATAHAAVRAHHGSIGAEPREGGGARFWFRVPVERADQPAG